MISSLYNEERFLLTSWNPGYTVVHILLLSVIDYYNHGSQINPSGETPHIHYTWHNDWSYFSMGHPFVHNCGISVSSRCVDIWLYHTVPSWHQLVLFHCMDICIVASHNTTENRYNLTRSLEYDSWWYKICVIYTQNCTLQWYHTSAAFQITGNANF